MWYSDMRHFYKHPIVFFHPEGGAVLSERHNARMRPRLWRWTAFHSPHWCSKTTRVLASPTGSPPSNVNRRKLYPFTMHISQTFSKHFGLVGPAESDSRGPACKVKLYIKVVVKVARRPYRLHQICNCCRYEVMVIGLTRVSVISGVEVKKHHDRCGSVESYLKECWMFSCRAHCIYLLRHNSYEWFNGLWLSPCPCTKQR